MLFFEKYIVRGSGFLFLIYCQAVLDHIALEKKKVYFNSNFAWHLNCFCFDFQFEAVFRHVLRLSLVRWMHKAVLIFNAAQHKLKQVLPKFIVLSCNGFGWEGIWAMEALDPPSQPTSHLLWELWKICCWAPLCCPVKPVAGLTGGVGVTAGGRTGLQ